MAKNTSENTEATASNSGQELAENPDTSVRQNEQQPTQQQQQQQQQESPWKTILFRMFIFYMIMNFFRGRGGQQQNTSPNQNVVPATNLFQPNTKMVSEETLCTS